jgi:hypothetical protein
MFFLIISQAKSLGSSEPEQENTKIDKLEDQMGNLTEHFLVLKATTVDPEFKCSVTVARCNCASIEPVRLERTFRATITALQMHDVGVCLAVGDGAGENVTFFRNVCTHSIADYIDDETRSLFKKRGMEEFLKKKVAMKCPLSGEPIFIVEDMPHVVKRIVNALDRSSKSNEARNLQYGKGQYMNLRIIEQVWELTGGKSNQLHCTKLTEAHFHKDNFSRMRVYLAVQVQSNSVLQLILKARDDERVKLPFHDAFYDHIIELTRHVNNLVDIINGRSVEKGKMTAHFCPEKASQIQWSLIDILVWFETWKKHNDELKMEKNAFLADETWNGLIRMILGYIGLLGHYVKKSGMTIAPRKTLSDPCEHFFSKARGMGGSTNTLTPQTGLAAVAREDLMEHCRLSEKGSYSQAPVERREMKRRKKY